MKKFCNVIACLIIFVVGYFCFFKYILKVDYIGLGPYRLRTISSESMRPEISPGDAVITEEIKEIKVGDIVYYTSSGTETMRKITKMTADTVTLKETYMGNEEEVEIGKITGRVIHILPGIGTILFQISQPWSFFIVAILVGSYFAFVYSKHA